MLNDVPEISTTFIAHLSGYVIGITLYSMLLGLVFQSRRVPSQGTSGDLGKSSPRWLCLMDRNLGPCVECGGITGLFITTPTTSIPGAHSFCIISDCSGIFACGSYSGNGRYSVN